MKLTIIICLILGACGQNTFQNEKTSSTPFPQTTLDDLAKAEDAKRIERNKRELKEGISTDSKKIGLLALESRTLPNEDLEIRMWRFSAYGDKNLIFILERNKGNWSANLLERKIAKKDIFKKNSFVKSSKRNLGLPKSGWELFWQRLTEAEILTLPDGDEVGNEVCPDCWVYIIETKVEGNYRIYDYHAPELSKENRETRQMVKIINTVSEEFNLDVFDSKNFYPSR